MVNNSLQIQQIDAKMQVVAGLKKITPPPTGWIKAVRTALGMSLQQLGNRLNITKQSTLDIEQEKRKVLLLLKH